MNDPIYRENVTESLLNNIDKAKKASPISAATITMLAASKTQSAAAIEDAIASGITVFGENRVQEAKDKWPEIKNRHHHIRLHLIGALQTNKTKLALTLFDVIQTLDRPELAKEIARLRDLGTSIADKKFYIQVNTGEEPQKAGVAPKQADEFIAYCKQLDLPVIGLMCVPPADQPPAPHFALLRDIAIKNKLPELSMGMSDDYEIAVRMGSSCVRIGTALFGKRL